MEETASSDLVEDSSLAFGVLGRIGKRLFLDDLAGSASSCSILVFGWCVAFFSNLFLDDDVTRPARGTWRLVLGLRDTRAACARRSAS